MNRASIAIIVLFAASYASAVEAQRVSPPDPRVVSAFTAETQRFVCQQGIVVIPPLLGEIAKNFSINPHALPPLPDLTQLPSLRGVAEPETADARFAAWIVGVSDLSQRQAADAGVARAAYEALGAIRLALSDYLLSLHQSGDRPYRIAAGEIGPDDDRAVLLLRFFAPVLHSADARALELACILSPSAATQAREQGRGRTEPLPPVMLAVRGRIDDLAVMRLDGSQVSEAFKKTSDATLAYTDNRERGEQSVASSAVVGVGHAVTPNDLLVGFIHYTQSTTERDAGDADTSKDVRALSPGILWRRSHRMGSVASTLGATVYPTFDFAQDSESLRARAFLSDISIDFGGTPTCGAERLLGPIMWNCRLGVFAEWAHVFDPGTSVDFQSLDDDEYFGVGGEVGLILGVPGVRPLSPFEFNVSYRYLGIMSGGMNDAERLTLGMTYRIPDSFVSVGLNYVRGENFETFQRENVTKFSVGFRY